jgi:hypothetical protein
MMRRCHIVINIALSIIQLSFSESFRYVVTGTQQFLRVNLESAKTRGLYKSKIKPKHILQLWQTDRVSTVRAACTQPEQYSHWTNGCVNSCVNSLEDGPVGPKHVEIRRYMNKIEIVTSVGFHFICWKDVRYKKLKISKINIFQKNCDSWLHKNYCQATCRLHTCTINIIDLLWISGWCSKHVEELNYM